MKVMQTDLIAFDAKKENRRNCVFLLFWANVDVP